MSNQEEKHILTNPWCKKNKAEFFGQGKTADCTCNPEEKKRLSECCNAEPKYWHEGYPDEQRWCSKCNSVFRAKPSPSQSCEHDKGDHWDSNINYSGFATVRKYERNKCPYCKPAAVEPSVESIAFALVHKFSIYTEDGTFFSNNEPNEPKKLELLIAEALRNERNRHG